MVKKSKRTKRSKRNKRLHGCFVFLIFLVLAVVALCMGILVYLDYNHWQAQQGEIEGTLKAGGEIARVCGDIEEARENLSLIMEQAEKNSDATNYSYDLEYADGEEGWTSGHKLRLTIKADLSSKNPFLEKTYRVNQTFEIAGSQAEITMVPAYISQTGIKGDYTNYVYFYTRWNDDSAQKTIADRWNDIGRLSKNNIAVIDNYYLVAVRPMFGECGDILQVVLEDGTSFQCIIADEKGDDAENDWGHIKEDSVSLVEFEVVGDVNDCYAPDFTPPDQWNSKKVSAIINLGRYSGYQEES